jgi:LmbE family N-acetylglucosaminyl deacetylase
LSLTVQTKIFENIVLAHPDHPNCRLIASKFVSASCQLKLLPPTMNNL